MTRAQPRHDTKPVPNALTFDVEEWFHAHNLGIDRGRWGALPSRLAGPIDDILALLDKYDTTATFFVLGWTAGRCPDLVRRIADAGHEVASHGFSHEPLTVLTRDTFRDDVRRSIDVLMDVTGRTVRGYRAPRYSVTDTDHWAFDELVALGFRYDSSVYPARAPHGRYGRSDAPLRPFRVRPGLWEFPLPVLRVLGRRFPVAAGAYLRLWPMVVTHHAFQQNRRDGIPMIVNVHPWELDPDQPRWPTTWRAGRVHYAQLTTTAGKLATLLDRHRFVPLERLHERCEAGLFESAKPPPAARHKRTRKRRVPATV
ncbi:MAG: XrtA system polysaccharide deacetylase [Phycisphaerae bacterium]